MPKFLHVAIIFEASSLNYGEGLGNIQELKKLTRHNGQVYTYMSRQKMRYSYANYGFNHLGWKEAPIVNNGTFQFDPNLTIEESEEMDLFGYMITRTGSGSSKRNAICRFSNAVSLETFKYDMDFGTNLNFAKRAKANGTNPVNTEIHQSYYTYDMMFDLDRVGIDGEIELDPEVKKSRILSIIEIMKLNYVDIKGRRESLAPLFIIGGIYETANPVFSGRIQLVNQNEVDIKPLEEAMAISYRTEDSIKTIAGDTVVGIGSKLTINHENTVGIQDFFDDLITKVESISF
jgi:CRISPR-associated protein Cst2